MRHTLFITGTDTGVGKTLLTRLLAVFLRRRGVKVAAFKPLCSGGRADARALHATLGGELTLDEINPWHFRAPITPLLAARQEKKSVSLAGVLAHIRARQAPFEMTLVEGAGGLLSPLGINFDSRDLICALRARPVIVAPNRLGVINHVRLTWGALPTNVRNRAKVVLMSPAKPDAASATNARLVSSWIPQGNLFTLPWLGEEFDAAFVIRIGRVAQTLRALTDF
ncbi:MAG TPA: dethiobiotin synthase [Candidatus Acidoferrum sp.]|nr:dethiobiotin synthase [Candidatus Acidoferrum sp.]